MTSQPTAHRLDVPGANLYYEVRGAGPVLLVIGQPMTSPAFAPIADLLADRYTVVTYDPHGLGQSTVEDPSLDVTPEIQADDLATLVEAVGGGPVDLFATSGGAVTGLAFAARHPELLRTLVAHEPPVTELLPDAVHIRSVVDEIEHSYRDHGAGAAWGGFVSLVIHSGPVSEDGVPPASWPPPDQEESAAGAQADQEPAAPSAKQQADDELFFLRMLKPFTRYLPAEDLLRSGSPRVLVAVGETSREELAARSARALAERLGTPPVILPGDHAGFMPDPDGFAKALYEVLNP